jgi:hypothetical protein
MAINYLAKLCESTSLTNPGVVTLTAGCAANSLVLVALAAKRSGATPGVVSVVDSSGNAYTVVNGSSLSNSRPFIAYCRTSNALTTSNTITVTWNGALTDAWISAHAFDNAGGTAHDTSIASATSTAPQVEVDVTGSDWLSFASFHWSSETTSLTVTPVNSSLSRDDVTNNKAECFSRNGTTGSTHTIGGTTAISRLWSGVAASFLVDPSGSGTGNKRGQPTLVGV